jgi:hypothetical protein
LHLLLSFIVLVFGVVGGHGALGQKQMCCKCVSELCVGFAALLFLRSVGLNFHVGWFWCLLNLRTVAQSMTYNEQGFAQVWN